MWSTFAWSLPLRERGLKLLILHEFVQGFKSLPLRERGLKHATLLKTDILLKSLPLRERGLKPENQVTPIKMNKVAPPAGAWIETGYRWPDVIP